MDAPRGSARGARRPIVLLAAGVFALTACTASPAEPTADDAAQDELEVRIAQEFDSDREQVAVAVIDGGDVRTAYQGADAETVFEVASITKGMTGELLASAIERGEVAAEDPVGQHLPLGDAPVASITLAELATHRSGLPDTTSDPELLAEFERAAASGEEPADMTVDELIALAVDEPAEPTERPSYSNLGAALLGHALAAAAGTDYPTLLRERLLEPLGMEAASVPITDDEIDPNQADGYTGLGKPAEAWADEAWAPSSGVHATLGDLVALAEGMLDGPITATSAQEPHGPGFSLANRLGWFWYLSETDSGAVVSHEGISGGFGAALLVYPAGDAAVVVLVNEASDVGIFAGDLLASTVEG
jgi:CubicO group peptidase (beta-lactamase class C family)